MSNLAAQFNGQPTMIDPEAHAWVEECVREVSESAEVKAALASPGDDFWDPRLRAFRPYHVENGALIIPVKGALMHNLSISYGGFATGYDYIAAAVDRGLADEAVTRFVFDIHSPGGAVAGCFTLVEKLVAAREIKPIHV